MALFNGAKQDILAERVKAVQTAEKQLSELGKRHDFTNRELAKAIETRRQKSLGLEDGTTSNKDYDAADAEVSRLQRELRIITDQSDATAVVATAARKALNEAGAENRRKDAVKLGEQRLKSAEKFVRAAELMKEAQEELLAINEKLVVWGGIALQMRHGGTVLSKGELLDALSTELGRVSNITPLTNQVALPGSKNYVLGGDPSKETPFVEVIRLANEHMVEIIALGPEPIEPARPKHLAPVEYTPAHSTLNVRRGLSEQEAAAMLGPRKRSLAIPP